MITNKNSITRLLKYKSALYRFRLLGFVKVFSDNLADATDATSAQVRKDFSIFGITGNKRGGYFIDDLINKINKILGKTEIQNVVIVGTGNIGSALLKYKGFEKENIKIVAGFDIDAGKHIDENDTKVFPLERLKEYITENNIKIGIVAVPDIAAQQVTDIMVQAGIKGILNFAPIKLRTQENIVVNNVNLGLELENVICFVKTLQESYEGN